MTCLKIAVLNGPNLNLLGVRQPEIYGREKLDDVELLCLRTAEELSDEGHIVEIDFRQTNYEGELIDWIHKIRDETNGIILNPAALGHSSVALLDALLAVDLPTVEVHITNIHQREAFRHQLYTAQAAIGVICGFGVRGYQMAIRALYDMFQDEDE